MSKKLIRGGGFGSRLDIQRQHEQSLKNWRDYKAFAATTHRCTPKERIDQLDKFLSDREHRGIQELRDQVDWLLEILRTQSAQIPIPTLYEGEDPLADKVTWISYVVLFSDGQFPGTIKEYKQDSISYPAQLDQAVAEVLPQFIYAVENGPTPEDFGNKQVEGFTTDEMLRIVAHLWHYRRLSPEQYEAERKAVFDKHWQEMEPGIIEQMRETNRRMKATHVEPTKREIRDRRERIRQAYKIALRHTFEATEKRLSAKQGSMQFRHE